MSGKSLSLSGAEKNTRCLSKRSLQIHIRKISGLFLEFRPFLQLLWFSSSTEKLDKNYHRK